MRKWEGEVWQNVIYLGEELPVETPPTPVEGESHEKQ